MIITNNFKSEEVLSHFIYKSLTLSLVKTLVKRMRDWKATKNRKLLNTIISNQDRHLQIKYLISLENKYIQQTKCIDVWQ